MASTNIDNESSPEVDFEPYVNTAGGPLLTPKELVQKGISLDLIGKAIGLGGLRFTPIVRERKEEDGNESKIEQTVDGGNGNNREAEWEDDSEEEDQSEREGEGELEIAVHMYATMTRPERKEMMDLLEANMKVMYVTLHLYIYLPTIPPLYIDIPVISPM